MTDAADVRHVTDDYDDIDLDGDTGRTTSELLEALLGLLREGRTRLDELADGVGLSGVDTERLVRAAELQGDVARDGYTGERLYTVRITDQGLAKLPPLTEREATLAEYDLAERDVDVLVAVAAAGPCTASTIRERMTDPLDPVALIPVMTHLVREGYLDESGLLRRYVAITPVGQEALDDIGGGVS